MDDVISEIRNFFRIAGHQDYMIHVSRFPREAVGFIPSLANDVPPHTKLRIYAVGGDGILFDCINGLMGLASSPEWLRRESGPGLELAVMPYGRTNSFMQGFGKKNIHLFKDVSLQCNAPVIPMDLMYDGANYAINFCTIGVESLSIANSKRMQAVLEDSSKFLKLLKRVCYEELFLLGGLRACLNRQIRNQYYTVSFDGSNYSGKYRGINIANAPWYGKNKRPVRNAMPNDGLLDVLFGRSAGFLRTISQVPLYMSGHYESSDDYTMTRGRKICINSEEIICYNLDHILFFSESLEIELLPAAIQFVDVSKQGYQSASEYT
jgi:diacylglycerol kinase family enzyme